MAKFRSEKQFIIRKRKKNNEKKREKSDDRENKIKNSQLTLSKE